MHRALVFRLQPWRSVLLSLLAAIGCTLTTVSASPCPSVPGQMFDVSSEALTSAYLGFVASGPSDFGLSAAAREREFISRVS